jgi:DNA (cytosine-5)-methyltransferase 1
VKRRSESEEESISMGHCVVDLYAGIGGLGLGIARAGFTLALSVDNDAILSEVHRLNFPNGSQLLADVASLTSSQILTAAHLKQGELVGLVGGSPCQGFSRIGRRNQDDRRNELFGQFFRLVSELRPAFYVAENVQGILDSQNSSIVSKALDRVRKDFVVLDPLELNAADFGTPTQRKRIFFIGYLPDKCDSLCKTDFDNSKLEGKTTVGIALSGLPHKIKQQWSRDENGWQTLRSRVNGFFGEKLFGDIPEGVGDPETISRLSERDLVSSCIFTQHTAEVVKRFADVLPGATDEVSRMPRLKKSGLCPTLRAGTARDKGSYMALRPIHYSEPRVITPREAARLQGFPDWFRFHNTKWHTFRGIGNSVSPLVAEALFRVILSKLKT